jgi:hypothetical protein
MDPPLQFFWRHYLPQADLVDTPERAGQTKTALRQADQQESKRMRNDVGQGQKRI